MSTSYTLQDDLSLSGGLYIANNNDDCVFDANDHNITSEKIISITPYSGKTATINMGSGTWQYSWVWEAYEDDVTINAETSTIKCSGAGEAYYFRGGGHTYNNFWFIEPNGYGVSLEVFGHNTFNDFKLDNSGNVGNDPMSVVFGGGFTQTVATFTAIGVEDSLIHLDTGQYDFLNGHGYFYTLTGWVYEEDTWYESGNQAKIDSGQYTLSYPIDIVNGRTYNVRFTINAEVLGTTATVKLGDTGTPYAITSTGPYNIDLVAGVDSDASIIFDPGTDYGGIILDNVFVYGEQHYLSCASGTISCDYLDISNSNATGGATWYAGRHSNDTTNNDGWIFGLPTTNMSLLGVS